MGTYNLCVNLADRISSAKGSQAAEHTMRMGQDGEKSPSVKKRLFLKECISASVNKSVLAAPQQQIFRVMKQQAGMQ